MKIGELEINGHAALAPMAGVADNAMRTLCRQFGAAYTVSELISAKGVVLGDRKSRDLFKFADTERPIALQIFGDDPVIMAKAAEIALEERPEMIDINMGCPAPKVANNGGGSALLAKPGLCGEIVKTVSDAVNVPVTVKIRIGIDENSINAVEIAKICEQSGAKAITVHGRTRRQMYAPHVNVEQIRLVKQAVGIPVIANGDIVDGVSAAKMIEQTNCDFLMVGRGAMGAPWVFQKINAYLNEGVLLPDPPLSYRMETLLKQVALMRQNVGEKTAMLQSRKHAAWYFTGMKGAASYRKEAGTLKTFEDLERLVMRILEENK